MKRLLAAIGAALALAGAGSTAALAADVYILSIPDNSHDMQSTEPPAWAQGDAPPAYEESVIEMPAPDATVEIFAPDAKIEVPAQSVPDPVAGSGDLYVIEPDTAPIGITPDRATPARP